MWGHGSLHGTGGRTVQRLLEGLTITLISEMVPTILLSAAAAGENRRPLDKALLLTTLIAGSAQKPRLF
jgi:hypothetical protein